MIVIEEIRGKLSGSETRRVERVALGWADRLRSRQRVTSDCGTELGISLPTGQALHEDDILYEDGERVIAVATVPDDVLVLYPETPVDLGRIAYQVGNRHAPVMLENDRVLTPYDSVLEEYFLKMGVRCKRANEPFFHVFGTFSGHRH